MRRATRFGVQGEFDNAASERFGNRRDASRTRLVFENAWQPLACVTLTPPPYFPSVDPRALSDLFVPETIRRHQNDPGTLACSHGAFSTTAQLFQFRTLLLS
jgi:hypothetical protein